VQNLDLLRLSLIVPLVACAAGPDRGAAAPSPHTRPMDHHSHSEPHRVRVTHVSLDLELDFDRRRAAGDAVLSLVREDRSAPLVLDLEGLEIEAVLGTDGSARAFEVGAATGRLGRPLSIDLAPGDERVRIRYATGEGAVALQWLEPDQTAGGRMPFLFTQGQSILTRSWIPLQDSPGVRVTYDARVRAPTGMTVVMSAEESSRDADGAFRFQLDRAIPPYLIALACGDLEFRAISGRAGVWADPTVVAAATAELSDTEAMIQSAEKLFGPYRWGRYDLLILPPAFPFGGMENPCLTFCTPTILAGDKSLVSLVAHELAHSWSGNLVTNATWRDFWLNEGFTVYFEARIMEAVFGKERAELEKELAYDDLVREMKELEPWAQVLHVDLTDKHPDDGFSGVPYEKGALFLRRVEELAGRDVFDRFLTGWFDAHAFQSVTTEDFLAWLSSELPDVSESIDLDLWIERPGLPADAPRAASRGLASVRAESGRYAAGAAPADLATDGWVTQQWLAFLEGQAERLDAAAMARLDETFGFTRTENCEVLCVWLRLAVKHGYAAADERTERFLLRVGRAKFLRPIFKELVRTDPARARALYERTRPRYHAVARSALDRIVGRTP
jgi:aminopeptidase N